MRKNYVSWKAGRVKGEDRISLEKEERFSYLKLN